MSSMRLILFGVWLTYMTGCSYIADLSLLNKNRRNAECAWKQESRFYRQSGMSYTIRQHFGCGFVKGYEDVANGSDGTPPLFPPQCYWGSAYQSPAGDEKVRAWFNGYQEGATAALRDGRMGTNELPTSWAPPGRVPYPAHIIPGEVVPPGTNEQAVVEPVPLSTQRHAKSEANEFESLPATTKEDPNVIPKSELRVIPLEKPTAPTKPGPIKTPATTPSQESSEVREPNKARPSASIVTFWKRAFVPRTEVVSPVPPNQLAGYQAAPAGSSKGMPDAAENQRPDVMQSRYIGTDFSAGQVGSSAEANVARPSFESPMVLPRASTNVASQLNSSSSPSGEFRGSEATVPTTELRDLFGPPDLNEFNPSLPTSTLESKLEQAPALRELFPGPDLTR